MPVTGLHITTALSSSWMPWVCLAMVLLVWMSCMMQPQYLRGLVSNSFSVFSANASEQVPSMGSQAAQWIFNIVVPAMGLFVMAEQEVVEGSALIGWVIVFTLLADVFRLLAALLVQYTFRLGRLLGKAYMRYYSLRSLFTFVLFIILLLVRYTSPHTLWLSVLAVASAVYIVTLGLQWGKLFCTSLLDAAGLLVYMITVELLPAVLVLEAGRQLYFLHIA